ncbi:methyltransferase domain-containing protein [Pseudoxanthomonas helianthi]|uniref:Methyltransferase domain-containing protein n=1 Tax=Pseudoxanthomonas helianthi TaxID=1453541 RepID=A0A940X648_9GAMM|nr:class I SAM-dependent methyltransferase [Pseudoxanthomonas helianthi]MBP3985866.1 methyltransferase domain-containing protein [Pseudoxanthomonas helianthi]
MHWRIKGTLQKALGYLPGGDALHFQLQRRFGGLRDFSGELASKIDDWTIMAGHLRNAGREFAGMRGFEIGTGWYPTFPFACYLAGAARITTYDLNPHLRADLTRACVETLERFLPVIAEAGGANPEAVRQRYDALRERILAGDDLETASSGVIHYRAPADATKTTLGEGEVDVVFSNSVLEHVPAEVIEAMYRESMRILAPGGIMFHSVNCGDHYAYVDRKLHQLHYLRYSDRQWQRWNNAFLYQNRLRARYFVDEARALGFRIELNTATARPERLRQLASTPVHAQFAGIPPEELCITSVDFIARKPRTAEPA